MFAASIALGVALAVVGLVGYFATGRKSVTALIPLFFGVAFVALGALGGADGLTAKIALGLSVLGVLGTGKAFKQLVTGPRGAAVVAKATMAALCLVFLVQQLLPVA